MWNDIRSKDLFMSPSFYLQQNDIIYVEPTGRRAREETRNRYQFWTSLFSGITTLVSMILLYKRL
jgi:polysaccharide export outer membrane protein